MLGAFRDGPGDETAIAFAPRLSHPTKPKYLTTFEMKGHIGGHFDRRTIADCRAESPGTEQLDSFLIQVRTVGTIDAYGAVRHHLPEGSAKGSTNIPHSGIGGGVRKSGSKGPSISFFCLLELHAQVGLLISGLGWQVRVAI